MGTTCTSIGYKNQWVTDLFNEKDIPDLEKGKEINSKKLASRGNSSQKNKTQKEKSPKSRFLISRSYLTPPRSVIYRRSISKDIPEEQKERISQYKNQGYLLGCCAPSQYDTGKKYLKDQENDYEVKGWNYFVQSNRGKKPQDKKTITLDKLKLDDIIVEGYLEKLTKGIRNCFLSRYCIITRSHFMYFKDMFSHNFKNNRPLLSVPFTAINCAKFVAFRKDSQMKEYFFEINIKKQAMNSDEDNERIQSVIKSPSKIRFLIVNQDDLIKAFIHKSVHFPSKEDKTEFLQYYNKCVTNNLNVELMDEIDHYIFNDKGYVKPNWTYREIDWYLYETKLIFKVKTHEIGILWVSLINWQILKLQKKEA